MLSRWAILIYISTTLPPLKQEARQITSFSVDTNSQMYWMDVYIGLLAHSYCPEIGLVQDSAPERGGFIFA